MTQLYLLICSSLVSLPLQVPWGRGKRYDYASPLLRGSLKLPARASFEIPEIETKGEG